jgi:single-strand DNA-binding protein
MLDSRNGGGAGDGGGYGQESVAYGNQGQGGGGARQMDGPPQNFSQDFDDEIPF